MSYPVLKDGEHMIRGSPGIMIKSMLFDLFLTNKRLIFLPENKKNRFDILLHDILEITPYESENGEPIYVLLLRDEKKKKMPDPTKRLIIIFPQQFEGERVDEADTMFSFIHAAVKKSVSSHAKAPAHVVNQDELQSGSQLRCRNCGRNIGEGTAYCTHCGTKVVKEVPKKKNSFSLSFFAGKKEKQNKSGKPDADTATAANPTDMTIPAGPAIPVEEPSEEMIPCPKCGEMIPDNSHFCRVCGKNLKEPAKKSKGKGSFLSGLFPGKKQKSP